MKPKSRIRCALIAQFCSDWIDGAEWVSLLLPWSGEFTTGEQIFKAPADENL
jgi:hypothetical protein